MKKVLFFAAGAMCFSAFASAQITLNQSGYSDLHFGADSVMAVDSGAALNSVNLTPATNAMWDLSGLSGTTMVGYRLMTTAANAQYADSTTLLFGSFAYTPSNQNAVTSDGIKSYGETITRKAYYVGDLLPFGGTSTDSVIIDSQNIVYSAPINIINFPATYGNGSHWSSTFNYDFHFELSLSILSYDHTPGVVRAYINRNDSVTGYGQMRVRGTDGNPSGYMDVLQIQSTETTVDSFFLNGSQAPSVVLNSFGFTQGQVSHSYTQYYYRPAELTPLAEVYYDSSAYTQPSGAQTHEQRLASPEAVATVKAINGIKVYPNPAVNNTVTVEMTNAQNTNYDYQLININGQIVSANSINLAGNSAQLSFTNAAAGIYYLRIMNNGRQTGIYPITLGK